MRVNYEALCQTLENPNLETPSAVEVRARTKLLPHELQTPPNLIPTPELTKCSGFMLPES